MREALAASDVVVETSVPPWSGEDVVALVSFEPVTADDLDRLPALRVIAAPSVGTDHIDVVAATRRGVWVCHVPDYCVEEMADHALALLLSLVRGVVELDRSVRSGEWNPRAAGALRRVSDVRLGIVGFGRIGRALAVRAQALGMEVGAYDPLVPDAEISAAGVRPAAALPDLLAASDAVSIHAPLTPKTRGLVGRHELARLPDGAYVVNVSRAGLVDTEALLQELESGRLAGVALDVLDVEPPSAAGAPSAARLVVTPHAGWYSERAEETAHRRAAASVLDVLQGREPHDAVNQPDNA